MRPAILALIGLAAGAAVYAARRWLAEAPLPPLFAAGLGVVCVGGLTALLLLREGVDRGRAWAALGWGAAWAPLFAWVFYRGGEFDFAGRYGPLAMLSILGAFLAAPFLAREWGYARWFARLCDNLLAAAAGLLVAGVSSLLIHLGTELFAILGAGFLRDWAGTEWFGWTIYPALFGAGMAAPVAKFRRGGLALFRLPGVVAAVFALTFAAALLTVGPAPLWERDIAAPLLLTFTIALLFFATAAFGAGTGAAGTAGIVMTKSTGAAGTEEIVGAESTGAAKKTGGSGREWTRGVLTLSLLTLPAFAGLALWGLWLRVEQYGLTPARVGGMLVGMFLLAAALCYAACALRALVLRGTTGPWLGGLRRANPALAMLGLGLLMLMHTPVLDPWRWSATSQVLRAADPATAPRDADLGVFYEWGGYGLAGLEELEARLRTEPGERAEVLLAELAELRAAEADGELEMVLATRGWRTAQVFGPATAAATEIVRAMKTARPHWRLACPPPGECALLAVDLAGDDGAEHCLIRMFSHDAHLDCFARDGGKFRLLGSLRPRTDGRTDQLADLLAALERGEWEVAPAAVRDVVIGGKVFFLEPNWERRRGF